MSHSKRRSRDDWDDPREGGDHRRKRDRDRERSRRRERKRPRTPEEKAYRAAQRRANARVGFVSHFVAYGATCAFLLFVTGFRPAMIVALGWGIGIACHYFAAIVAPEMRRRFLEREVSRQVAQDGPLTRQNLSDRHERSLEDLSAQVAHEIRNPITAAKSLVQQMGEDPTSNENVDYAKVALDELDRVERSVAHLLRFARDEDLQLREVRFADVVDSALESFRDRLDASGITVDTEIGTRAVLHGDPDKLRRVLINLVGNALDALQGSATPDPRLLVQAGENLAGTECWVRVRDNGPGIDPEALRKIFSPFYTSKDSGTGLGLAISKKVVDAHGGSIEAQSEPGDGTEFTITIPKRPSSARANQGQTGEPV
ncbi:MAG: HAMP domain-containing sensor histidine kinase [Myxococcota bacterium]